MRSARPACCPATASPSRIVANIAMIAIILAASIEAAKQLGGGTIAIFLAQVTELGGKVIFGTLIIVVGIFLARIIANLVGSGTGEGGYRPDHRPLCDHRLVHRHRPDLHGPCRPDRDDGVRADPRLGRGRDRARLRAWRPRRRRADRSSAGSTTAERRRRRRLRPGASAPRRATDDSQPPLV